MSQSTLSEPDFQTDSAEPLADLPVASASDMHQVLVESEYHYRPIPVLTPAALFLGLTSLIAFITPVGGILVGICGTILGTICFLGILRNRAEVGGFKMTALGLLLSFASAVYGSGKLAYDYNTEVPDGYERISFYSQISKVGFIYDQQTGTPMIHPDVAALDGRKIFVKGFMYPTRKTEGITEFIMAKDNGQCCFGGEPQITDMIYVKLDKPLAVDFSDERVSVSGVFKAGKVNQAEGLMPIYELQAQHFSISKTMF
ncbi:MAG TPA: DUF3299 domain-containing protein [Planctomycetaceae bacterium]|nr:DUF3299 domain-containing protein [Planctomycetaceae bacterium]